jgi:5'(3')-deoxyribonucleotidase
MRKRPIIFVDVDEVCAEMHIVWLKRYNLDYDDNVQPSDIKSWMIHQYVKPECGYKFYDYLKDPSLYDEVMPVEGAQEGVESLREMGYRIFFPTSTPVEASGRKFYWLKEWGFIKNEREYIELRDKSVLYGRYMLDDNYDNIKEFVGYGWLYTRPWNDTINWYHRTDNWKNFIEVMKENNRKGV